MSKTIVVKHPWNGRMVERNIEGLTQAELETYPLDERVCEEITRALAPCLPEEFFAAYVKRVGAIKAGIVLFGARVIGGTLSSAGPGSMTAA